MEFMPTIKEKSIDMILCDLPYGTTQCKWDVIIPFKPLWNQYERIIKDNGAIVLTASQPFTSALVMSNPKMFKYSLVWDKIKGTGFLNARKQPMRNHEDILVFYKNPPTYNPQKTHGHNRKVSFRRKHLQTDVYGEMNKDYHYDSTDRYIHPEDRFYACTGSFEKLYGEGISAYAEFAGCNPRELGYIKLNIVDGKPFNLEAVTI